MRKNKSRPFPRRLMPHRKGRDKYICFTLICLIAIILLQAFYTPPPSLKRKITAIDIDKEKIEKISEFTLLGFLAVVYIGLLAVGVANIILLIIKKIRRELSETISEPIKKLSLSRIDTSKLFFFIAFFILIIQIGEIALLTYKKGLEVLDFLVFTNFLLEIGVIIIILNFISVKFLGFTTNKLHLFSLFKLYTTILPLVVASLFLSSFILEKMGIAPQFNPLIQLILLLKNKGLVALLFLQIVLFGPVAEELFFRGFIYKLMRTKHSFFLSAITVSFIFAFLHRTPFNILPLFIISLALCYLYEKTQSMLNPIIFHSLHNILNLSFLFAMKDLL